MTHKNINFGSLPWKEVQQREFHQQPINITRWLEANISMREVANGESNKSLLDHRTQFLSKFELSTNNWLKEWTMTNQRTFTHGNNCFLIPEVSDKLDVEREGKQYTKLGEKTERRKILTTKRRDHCWVKDKKDKDMILFGKRNTVEINQCLSNPYI